MCPRAQRDSGLDLPFSFTPIQLAVRGQCATITLEEAPRRVRMTCNTRRRTVTKGTHLLRSALLALLALAVISGGSLAAGDLFDDDYDDCPHKTRLRDGQIADLSVNRDSDDEDEINVSWAATDPATWGLGPNAYSTSLVVILDDDDEVQTKILSLGSRSTTFDSVDTGVEVTVEMAIVTDTADGDYLISDILRKSINQSLTEPVFMADVMRITRVADDDPDSDPATDDAVTELSDVTAGDFYYVGYNENFGNYKADTYTFATTPTTPRLRIGLANTELDADGNRYASDKGPYDEVDFDAYILRIVDESGNVVPEGDDVPTRASGYDTRLVFGTIGDTEGGENSSGISAFSNVRINDGGAIQPSVHDDPTLPSGGTLLTAAATGAPALSYVAPAAGTGDNTLFALPPDEHRDFPVDVLSSDETYTITAWAVNDDDEVISPVATLKLRPIDEKATITAALDDYQTATNADPAAGSNTIYVTEFTVLK